MKNHPWMRTVILAGMAAIAAMPLPGQQEALTWHSDYQEAREEAKRTGKPIFLEFRCEP